MFHSIPVKVTYNFTHKKTNSAVNGNVHIMLSFTVFLLVILTSL